MASEKMRELLPSPAGPKSLICTFLLHTNILLLLLPPPPPGGRERGNGGRFSQDVSLFLAAVPPSACVSVSRGITLS